jgi:SAM-dependent methyltransferase
MRALVKPDATILDVGCGNHSPAITKHYLPRCTYTGVDIIPDYNLDDRDRQCMDGFMLVGADGSGYDRIPDNAFDAIIVNDSVEHMANPLPVIATLCRKLRRGGHIYLAFPALKSLALPSGRGSGHTLHFCDDATHVWIPDIRAVAQTLLDQGVKVLYAGESRNTLRYLIGAALYPLVLLRKVFTGHLHAQGLWHFYGMEDAVIGRRR